MANKKITLVWLTKTDKGWRRFPVILAKNGRVKTGWVREANGDSKCYPEGRFQVLHYVGSKPVYVNAGLDPGDALAMRDRLARRKEIETQAGVAGIKVVPEKGRVVLREAVPKFIQRCKDTDAEEAAKSYTVALDNFMLALPDCRYVDQIDEEAMVKFGAALRKKGNGQRTISNKHKAVITFMRWSGVEVKPLKIKTPKYEKKLPVVYSEDQVTALLRAAPTPYYHLVLETLRMTGLREQEAVHLGWQNIDFTRKMIQVRSKPEYEFRIKDREERDVPMPDALAKLLRAWQKTHGENKLVLGNKDDNPHQKWLRLLKRTAKLAGLNCGMCDGCREQNECGGYTLHSFRRTYATTLHRKGVDVRTLMNLLGHADIETTLKYLAPMKAEESHTNVNRAFA